MDEDYKIWYPHEFFYIESLLSITRTVLSEQAVIVSFLDEYQRGNNDNGKLLLDSVQNIICQAAMLSKFFWPVGKDSIRKKRGQALREAYQILESNCLKSRDVRNYIEHFDEKLDKYLNQFITGTIIPLYVGPRINLEAKHIFRGYYTDAEAFTILGIEYPIIPIVEEVERIHKILEENAFTGRLNKS